MYKDNKNGYVIVKINAVIQKKSVKKIKKCMYRDIVYDFRTGSILIVGHCEESILDIVYQFLKTILIKEYKNICINYIPDPPKIKKKNS